MSVVNIGVHPGTRRRPAAICVAEVEERDGSGPRFQHFVVRHLERLPPGTPYPQVADRLGEIVEAVCERTDDEPDVFADVTGLGQPVADLLRSHSRGAPVWPVYFTHGDRRSEEAGETRLGKAWLVARLQTLLQSRQLHLPRPPQAEELARDLLEYEVRVSDVDNDRPGAFRVGRHDDLVTALGLAVHLVPGRWSLSVAVLDWD